MSVSDSRLVSVLSVCVTVLVLSGQLTAWLQVPRKADEKGRTALNRVVAQLRRSALRRDNAQATHRNSVNTCCLNPRTRTWPICQCGASLLLPAKTWPGRMSSGDRKSFRAENKCFVTELSDCETERAGWVLSESGGQQSGDGAVLLAYSYFLLCLFSHRLVKL